MYYTVKERICFHWYRVWDNSWLVDFKLKLTFFAIKNKALSLSKLGMHKKRCKIWQKLQKLQRIIVNWQQFTITLAHKMSKTSIKFQEGPEHKTQGLNFMKIVSLVLLTCNICRSLWRRWARLRGRGGWLCWRCPSSLALPYSPSYDQRSCRQF